MRTVNKSIRTLIPDIYRLLESGSFKIDGKKLGEMLEARLSEERGPGTLRMSNLGTPCERKLWLSVNRPDLAAPFDGPTKLKFLIGDIIEELVLSLAEQAGHQVEGRQDELEVSGIKGHRDAIIDGVLVDVKSANSRSFYKFKKHSLPYDDPFGYLDQLNLYLESSRDDERVRVKKEAAFLAVDKELGHLVLDLHEKRERDWNEIVKEKKEMLAQPEPPKCAYPLGPRGGVPMQCKYCQFYPNCHKGGSHVNFEKANPETVS